MDISTYEPQNEFVRRWGQHQRARIEGLVNSLLLILEARDIEVPEHARSRITGCTIINQLDEWIRHAATADTIDEVFEERDAA